MLGRRIATLRKSKGISQEELADVLLTSRQAISKWERGESDPDIDRLKDLAVYFNVSIDYLLGYDVVSNSVNSFIKKLNECVDNKQYIISLEDIKKIISLNPNNFNLYINTVNYLYDYYAEKREEEALDMVIEYSKKSILLYQPKNSLDVSVNEIHRAIARAYVFKKRYDLAKAYLIENNTYDVDEIISACDYELGQYDEAAKIVSDTFLKSIASIINGNILQIRLFLRTNDIKEALDLTNWSINFIKSVGKNEELFLEIVFVLTFIKAACEGLLKIDNNDSLKFLKENYNHIVGFRSDSDAIKFYNNKRVSFVSDLGNIKLDLLEHINKLKEHKNTYKEMMNVYQEIFGGD